MKKVVTTILFFLLGTGLNSIKAQYVIPFDASDNWLGRMTWYEMPQRGGAFLGSALWEISDLVVEVDEPNNIVTLKPARVQDLIYNWSMPVGYGEGEVIMQANCYVEDPNLRGKKLEFFGNVISNTLKAPPDFLNTYIYEAFIKVFSSDYSILLAHKKNKLNTVGDFSIYLDATQYNGTENIQYGFQVTGPNVQGEAEYDELYESIGSIIISDPSILPLQIKSFTGSLNRDREIELIWDAIGSQNEEIEFSVLHSLDGYNFSSIEELSKAQSQFGNQSMYKITSPQEGINYFIIESREGDYMARSSIIKIDVEPVIINEILYPNPSNNTVSVNGIEGGATIISVDGKVVANFTSTLNMNISDLANGLYLIKTKHRIYKFIKQ